MNPNQKSVSVPQAVIHHDAALRVIQAAVTRAEALGIRVCVAVVDSAGTLAGFVRMPGAFLISGEIATRKAHSTAAIGVPAELVEQALAQEAPRVREGIVLAGFYLIRGAAALRDGEDMLIGAVGVSGGSESQDVECAQAAAAALQM
ncbi:MAG: GlcG/HbpS family heme-binding protein [Panacagrimonas sp.]